MINGFRGTVRLSRERLYPPRQSSLTVLPGAQIELALLRKWPSVRDLKAAEEEHRGNQSFEVVTSAAGAEIVQVSGAPDSPGKVPVVVTVTIDREVRKLDERALSWGLEKLLSTSTQRVGVATQKFTIEVAL